MECPYCKDTIPAGAWVCKTCRRELQMVTALKDQLAQAQADLEASKAQSSETQSAPPRVRVVQVEGSRTAETVTLLFAAIVFPALAYNLRVLSGLSPKVGTAAIVVSAGAVGFVIGMRQRRRQWAWFAEAILVAILQVAVFSLAFGCAAHAYYAGQNNGIKAASQGVSPAKSGPAQKMVGSQPVTFFVQRALRNRYLWFFQGLPAVGWFVILAFIGRTIADKKKEIPHKTIGSSLARRVTVPRPQEAPANFQLRLEGYTKIFDSLTHVVIVLLSIVTSYYALHRSGTPPSVSTEIADTTK